MGRILAILIILTSSVAWSEQLDLAPFCEAHYQHKQAPFMRLNLSPFGFKNQLEKILTAQIPNVEKSVKELNLQDKAIGANREPCPRYRDEPGMEKDNLCLFIPKILLGEEIALRDFKAEIKESVGLRMNFDNIQIPEFQLRNPELTCDFKNGYAECDLTVDVPHILIQSHFDFIDPREEIKIFSTVSASQLEIKATDKSIPRLRMKAKLSQNDSANTAIDIVDDSMVFDIPDGTLSSNIKNDPEDIVDRAADLLEEEIDPSLSEEEKVNAMLALIESDRGHEILEGLTLSFGIVSLAKDFIGDKDVLAAWQQPLLDMVDEPLSILLSDIIEGVLPFENDVDFQLPVPPIQDRVDGKRYFEKFQEIQDYLDQVESTFGTFEKYGQARETRRDHRWELKKIARFTEQIQDTQLEGIAKELRVLSARMQIHSQFLESTGLLSRELRKELIETNDKISVVADIVEGNVLPTYRRSRLHIDRVGEVNSDGIELLVAGCHIGGLKPELEENWHSKPPIKAKLDDNHFSVELPVSLINQHLELLHKNGFYDYCVGRKGLSCAESAGDHKMSLKITKAPRIRMRDGTPVFEMPEVERRGNSVLPGFFDRMFFQDNTRIRVCIEDLVIDQSTGRLIPNGCIDAKANLEKNFQVEHALSFLNLWSAIAVFGIKLTHTAAQEAILDDMEDQFLAESVDDILLRNGDYIVRELRVQDGRFSIFGQVDTKSE